MDGFATTGVRCANLRMLSLLLQAGWKWVIFLYAMMIVVVTSLTMTDILPLPFSYNSQCPDFAQQVKFAPWTLIFSFVSSMLGLLTVPYLPEGFATHLVWDSVCFLDAVSINQTDDALMERGIYGLGGFLRVSRELRVLWSRPYLTRLSPGAFIIQLPFAETSHQMAVSTCSFLLP